jgi:hypothetical protein
MKKLALEDTFTLLGQGACDCSAGLSGMDQ